MSRFRTLVEQLLIEFKPGNVHDLDRETYDGIIASVKGSKIYDTGSGKHDGIHKNSTYNEVVVKRTITLNRGSLNGMTVPIEASLVYRCSDHNKLDPGDERGIDIFIPDRENFSGDKYMYFSERDDIWKYKLDNPEQRKEYIEYALRKVNIEGSDGILDTNVKTIPNILMKRLVERLDFLNIINKPNIVKDLINLSDQDFVSKYKMTNLQHRIFFEPWFCSFLAQLKKNINQNAIINNVGMGQR